MSFNVFNICSIHKFLVFFSMLQCAVVFCYAVYWLTVVVIVIAVAIVVLFSTALF